MRSVWGASLMRIAVSSFHNCDRILFAFLPLTTPPALWDHQELFRMERWVIDRYVRREWQTYRDTAQDDVYAPGGISLVSEAQI
jgi:hypothetical protein